VTTADAVPVPAAQPAAADPVFVPIEQAIADIAAGQMVVVVDDADRENEGDLIFAASKATSELLAFLIHYTSGVVCVPMEGRTLDRLHLPPMYPHNSERMGTAFTVSVDAREGVTTGISAAVSRRQTGRAPSGCWSTPPPSPTSCPGRATCFRCGRARAAC